MPTYVYRGTIDPSDAARRDAVRPAHLAYQRTLTNLAGGPITDDEGSPIGSVIVFEAPDRAAADARVMADPYISEGVVSHWTVDVFIAVDWPGDAAHG